LISNNESFALVNITYLMLYCTSKIGLYRYALQYKFCR